MSTDAPRRAGVLYPESDGKPMADSTLQWDWMVKIVGELREQFAGREVFVAGDLFWYPVEGHPEVVAAPDALVAFGRPPGYRGSYRQWEEGGVAPQVVFEVLSPSNTTDGFDRRLVFYDRHGVEEYYHIDPYTPEVFGFERRGGKLVPVQRVVRGYVSPRLGTRFDLADGVLRLFGPDGREFQTREERVGEILTELEKTAIAFEQERERAIAAERQAAVEAKRAEAEAKRAEAEAKRAEGEARRAEQKAIQAEAKRAEAERRAKDILADKLRELGLNPDDLLRPAS